MRRLILSVILGLGVLGFLSGCGGAPKLYPVEGNVTLNGKPLSGGQVVLQPDDPNTRGLTTGGPITGGRFACNSPAGKYKVTIIPAPPTNAAERRRSFNAKFEDTARTPLTVEVVASPPPGAYDLKLTK